MTVRSDFSYNMELSPRIITVALPSTVVNIQDLHDTITSYEDSREGGQFPRLIQTGGGEDLDGGTSVGLTSTLQDAVLAFQARTTPEQTGTATSTGTNILTDTAATFIANGVERGAMLINYTDGSIATVIEVLTETTLRHEPLESGVSNDWSITDSYSVTNEVQCNVSGGNMVAVGADLVTSIDPIFPTVGTQVVRSSSSSATTAFQGSLNFATYNNEIQVDQTNSTGLAQAGTVFPAGTGQQPVLSVADAIIIAVATGVNKLRFRGNYTFAGGDNVDGYVCFGDGPNITILDLGLTTSTVRSQFRRCELTGDINGAIDVESVHVNGITGVGSAAFETNFNRCILRPGTAITLSATPNLMEIHLVNCDSGSAGDTPVILDYNGADVSMTIHKYGGGMRFDNNTVPGTAISYDGDSHMTVDASCTEGSWAVRGDVKITNNASANPNVTILDQGTYTRLLELWARLGLDPTKPMTTNDDNSVTVGGITIGALNGATDTVQTRTGTL
ncbi:MAG: hypothetical protein ACI9GW_001974 [Halieaceae bacterium]|jgi:hypothetical protein